MKTKLRYYVAYVMVFSMLLGLLACGEDITGNAEYYLFENDFLTDLSIGTSDIEEVDRSVFNRILLFEKSCESFYTNNDYSGKQTHMKTSYIQIDLLTGENKNIEIESTVSEILPKKFSDNFKITATQIMPNGNILHLYTAPREYRLEERIGASGITYEQSVVIDDTTEYCLAVWNSDGKIEWVKDLSGDISDVLNQSISKNPIITVSNDGRICLRAYKSPKCVMIMSGGNEIHIIELPNSNNSGDIICDFSGNIYFYESNYSDGKTYFKSYCFDPQSLEFEEFSEFSVLTNGIPPKIVMSSGKDVYLDMSGAIWHIDENDELEKLFEWLDIGLTSDMICEFHLLDQYSGTIVYKDSVDDKYYSAVIKKCEISEYLKYYAERNGKEAAKAFEEKKELRIFAAENLNIELSNSASKRLIDSIQSFNRTNQQYKVKLEQISGDESTVTGNLMRKMLSGDIPDLIAFSDGMRSRNFTAQNLFSNIYELMDEDDTFTRDSFLPCILETFENENNELLLLTTNFGIKTIGMSSEKSNMFADLTLDTMIEQADKLSDDVFFVSLDGGDSVSFLRDMLSVIIDDFIDYSNQSCDFKDTRFKRFLEFCKDVSISDTGTLKNNSLFIIADIEYPSNYITSIKAELMGDEIDLVGYPGKENTGNSAISAKMQFAIPNNSENKDGAWSFLMTYVDRQIVEFEKMYNGLPNTTLDLMRISGFPCTWKATEAMFDYLSNIHSLLTYVEYTDKNTGALKSSRSTSVAWNYKNVVDMQTGESTIEENYSYREAEWLLNYAANESKNFKQVYGSDYTVEVSYGEYSEKDIDSLRNIFSSKCRIVSDDTETLNIITEEASAYFAGERSIEDTVKLIQDRVTTRISE